MAPPEVAQLYEQAVAAQWDAARDIPWDTRRARCRPRSSARSAQVMTFLAENELSALYVPSRFLPRMHPAYVETAQFLATQLADEARHIDVFLRRARAGRRRVGVSSVDHLALAARRCSSSRTSPRRRSCSRCSARGPSSICSRFIEQHAPDEATAELARRARADEARHVHFGVAHVRHALAHDPTLYARLEAAVRAPRGDARRRGGVPAPIQDALTILAARGDDPPSVARGHEAFRELLDEMHEGRIKRLEHAGFTPSRPQLLSELHTPNFM